MATSTTAPLILVDGSSYLFRAYFALPPLSTKQGEPTGAMVGTINMLRKLMGEYPDEHIAVVFDTKGENFRHQLYPEYKANRAVMPDDLACQIEPLHELIKAMGLPLIMMPGIEADDIIATLACQADQKGMKTIIVSSDKDLAQLVNDNITMLNTMTQVQLDREGVIAKFGVPPEKIIDYLALIGDSVDNIPGVPKVGPKTAAKWLTQYGSLEEILLHADEIKGKVGENLRASLEILTLSEQLVTLDTDIKLPFSLDTLHANTPDVAHLNEQLARWEIRSWLKEEAPAEKPSSKRTAEATVQVLGHADALAQHLTTLNNAKKVALQIHTTNTHIYSAQIIGIALAADNTPSVYIPLAEFAPDDSAITSHDLLSQLTPLFARTDLMLIGENLKFIFNVLARHNIIINANCFDVSLASYVLNSTRRHTLFDLAAAELDITLPKPADLAKKGDLREAALDALAAYSTAQANALMQLQDTLWQQLSENEKDIFHHLEMPVTRVLSHMESTGVLIDAQKLKTQSQELGKQIDTLTQAAYHLAGSEFNLDSPKQLQHILFEEQGLPILKKTPKGQPSTAEGVLQELALTYPLPNVIIEYRSLSKLKSTYTDPLPEQIHEKTGRVHTVYQQAVTSTGRLSSTNPNLQNIPIRTAEGRRIRQAFIAPTGYQLLAADYSQIELRIMAHLSNDAGLVKAFRDGLDIHKATAAEIFGVPLDNVTSNQRRSAKAINFGLIYGMSAFGLSQQLGVDRKSAEHYMDEYFHRYPGVKDYMENTRRAASKNGFVETLSGRRLYLPEIKSKQIPRRKAAERAAINAPMQGTAAEIIKRAMIAVDDWLARSNVDARLIMQVHDELVLEVAESSIDTVSQEVKKHMAAAAELTVPLVVDVGIGHNWDEAH